MPLLSSGRSRLITSRKFVDVNNALLMHFDGLNGSTSFVDQTGKTITPFGNAQISTAQSQFGGASGLFDGDGDYLTVSNISDFEFGSNNFTIEAFVYPTGGGRDRLILSKFNIGNPRYFLLIDTNNKLLFRQQNAGGGDVLSLLSNTSIPLNTWTYIAVVRSGDTFTAYINGVADASITSAATITGGNNFYIGIFSTEVAEIFKNYFIGYIDEMRISKIARSITGIPSSAFP